MKQLAITTLVRVFKAIAYGLVGSFIMLLVVAVSILNGRPDLKVWHKAELESEFTRSSPERTLEEYLALEDRLFAELDEKVYGRIEPEDQRRINRYHRGSLSDPTSWSPDWNRTFELTADKPVAGFLLLHGMSDSPYSLRHTGQQVNRLGAWVLGLRLPGHGTAPSGMVEFEWEDMAAAVRLGMRRLKEKVGDAPIYIVGYSNGGALAVEYAISSLEDGKLPRAQGMILISPSIGVTPAAALAVWQGRLGWVLGLKKLAWTGVQPEFDPYKYSSFSVNAGHQVHRLTTEIASRLDRMAGAGTLEGFPRILAFQSAVDATVSPPALVNVLFKKLPNAGHELVLFDINRLLEIEPLMASDPTVKITELIQGPDLPFSIRFITNEDYKSDQMRAVLKEAGKAGASESELGMAWPPMVYSLAHVALPFTPDDPIYGGAASSTAHPDRDRINLGNLALRGERGMLQVPAADMLRLRWNPFIDYLDRRTLEFAGLKTRVEETTRRRDSVKNRKASPN